MTNVKKYMKTKNKNKNKGKKNGKFFWHSGITGRPVLHPIDRFCQIAKKLKEQGGQP